MTTHKYTSYNKKWVDDIEKELKKKGANMERKTEKITHVKDKDGKVLQQVRDDKEIETGNLKAEHTLEDRILYILKTDKLLDE